MTRNNIDLKEIKKERTYALHYGAMKFIKLFLTSITHQIKNQFDRISLRNSLISNLLCAHAKHVSLKLQNGCAQILNSAGVYR